MSSKKKVNKSIVSTIIAFFCFFQGGLLATPGIDPVHSDLNKTKKKKLYDICNSSSGTRENCEQAILYDLHLKDNIHKGVSSSEFYTATGSKKWLDALKVASEESGYFGNISNDADSSLFGAIQSNINSSSMGYEMTTKFNRLAQNIDAYSSLMDTNLRAVLLEHKIEAAITQLLFNSKMEEEIRSFNNIEDKYDYKGIKDEK